MRVTNYAQAARALSTARNQANGKPIARNTRLYRRGDAIAVRFHNTDVVTYYPDGFFKLNTGGWNTVTTRERMHACTPDEIRVGSRRREMYVSTPQGTYPFSEGMIFAEDGTLQFTPELV